MLSKWGKICSIVAVTAMLTTMLAACGGGAATATPPAAATATTAPAAAATDTAAPEAEATATTAEAEAEATNTTAPAEAEATATLPPISADLVEAAKTAAGTAAEGQQLGGTLNLLGVWAGSELDNFMATVQPFEEATGTKIEYEATRDFNAVLTTRVNGGNPPDIAAPPSASQVAAWAGEGKLVALDDVVDMDALRSDYGQSWIDLASFEGKLYGVFVWSSVKGLIWYNPKQYQGPNPPATWEELMTWSQETANSGTTPWCIGLESAAASGWPGTDWLEDIMLRMHGPDKYDQWYKGELAWTSPEVKSVWEEWGKIATDPKMVYGGPTTELTLAFGNGGDQLFKDPPGCFLHHQASFITDFFSDNNPGVVAGEDYDFFGFPDINSEYANSAEVVADEFSIYKDTPQARAFIRYLTTPEAQSIWVSRGGKLPTNKRVSTDVYPDEQAKKAGEIITSAETVRFDASDLMPEAVNAAFWRGILDYVQNPGNLDSILTGLDETSKDAYGNP